MIQYLENKSGKYPKFWKIEVCAKSVITYFGKIGEVASSSTKKFKCENEILKYYKDQVLKKLVNGYIDPQNNLSIVNFQDNTFYNFLKKHDYASAINWLDKFDDLYIANYEDKLVNAHIENNKLIEINKYIFGKIKYCQSVDIVIRHIRYLSTIDPMMCRVMIGNMPAKPQSINLIQYYKDFAIAQSRIGMINASDVTLKNIYDTEVKLIYLTYLLDSYHQQSELQISILKNAIEILKNANFDPTAKNTYYLLLSKGALKIDQNEIAEKLYKTAQNIINQENT